MTVVLFRSRKSIFCFIWQERNLYIPLHNPRMLRGTKTFCYKSSVSHRNECVVYPAAEILAFYREAWMVWTEVTKQTSKQINIHFYCPRHVQVGEESLYLLRRARVLYCVFPLVLVKYFMEIETMLEILLWIWIILGKCTIMVLYIFSKILSVISQHCLPSVFLPDPVICYVPPTPS